MTTARTPAPAAIRPRSLDISGRWVGILAAVVTAGVAGLLTAVSPVLALAAVAALALIVVLMADLTWGLVAFIVIQFLTLLPFFSGSQLTGVKAAGALLAMSWLAVIIYYPERANLGLAGVSPRLTATLIAFIAWGFLSTSWAISRASTTDAMTRFTLNAILLAIVFSAVPGTRELRLVAGAIALGATLTAAVGLALGIQSADERLTGTVGDPNELAALLVPGLLICLALGFTSRSNVVRGVFLAGAGVSGIGIALSGSRGGLIAVGVALIVWFVFGGRWRGRIGVVVSGLLLGGLLYFRSAAPSQLRDRVTSFGGGTGREDIWKIGWRAFTAKPLEGYGAGNFVDATPRFLLKSPGLIRRADFIIDTPKVAHNTYLHILVELGIVGFALFALVLIGCIAAMVGAARIFAGLGDAQSEMLVRALVAATAGLLAAFFFISGQHERELWVLLALGPAALAVARRQAGRDPATVPRNSS